MQHRPAITVYSDYVCPFCFLEVPALDRLMREEDVQVDWRAFELRPEPVPTLDPKGEYLTNIWRDSVYPLAERLGVPIQLPPVQPRSRLAFEGAEQARQHGLLHPYNVAVFRAFFQDGRDIGQLEVLAQIAVDVGLDETDFRQAVESHRHLPEVLRQEREAQELGIHSVPTSLIGTQAVPGLVSYEVMRKLVKQEESSPIAL